MTPSCARRATARAATGTAATVLVGLSWLSPPVAAAAEPVDPPGRTDCALPGEVFDAKPWPQTLWDLRTTRTLTEGQGVRVAVLSSGVDGTQDQLRGRVERGASTLPDTPPDAPGDQDCTGLGTGLASLVVAQPVPDVGLRGIAPQAQILPLAVSDTVWFDEDPETADAVAARVAAAVRAAVAAEVEVILVGGYLSTDSPEMRAAVADAVAADVAVVAPVRDATADFTTPSYPAAHDGVLGVAAMAQDLTLVPGGETGASVDVVAPGANLATAARGSGHAVLEGTSGAAALAAGTAALVLSRQPGLTAPAVIDRLRSTAGPIANEDVATTGAGLLDPERAVAESTPADGPRDELAPNGFPEDDLVAQAAAEARRARDLRGLSGVGAASAAVVLIALGTATVRRGRRHGWGSTVSAPHGALDAPAGPPRALFRSSDESSRTDR